MSFIHISTHLSPVLHILYSLIFVRIRGIEPRSHPWQGCVLPLNHIRFPEDYTVAYELGNYWCILTTLIMRSRGEMDITAVFGTAIPGSNPGGSTKAEMANCFAVSDTCAGRSVVLEVDKTASRGRGNSIATAIELSVASKYPKTGVL